LKQWLLAPRGQNYIGQNLTPPSFNYPYLSGLARRYAIATAGMFVSSLFFVSGLSATIFAAAYDVEFNGGFTPGALFFTALGMTVLALLGAAISLSRFRGTRIEMDSIYLKTDPSLEAQSPMDLIRLAPQFLHGLVKGWKQASGKNAYYESPRERNFSGEAVDPFRARAS
jgi:hypothetical protein